MERNFMGSAVKSDTTGENDDSAPVRSLAMQWSFSNKVSPLPQLLSFQDVHEEKPKTGFDSLASTGLVSITTTEAFDSDHNPYSGVMQKNVIPDKQAGPWYRMTTYPVKHLDSRTIHRSILNQENVTVSPAGLHLIGSASPQPHARISMAHPIQAIPSSSPVVGTTDLRNIPKISTAPAQLTIFYAGSVCVYDNISPQKAQAIMLLAGNGPPTPSSTTLPVTPVQASMPRSSVFDGFIMSQPYGSTPYHSGPIPITALSISHSAGGSAINRTTVNPGVTLPSSSKIGPVKVLNSLGTDPASATLLSSTVPQFRRKSLARFLEKRKERVIAQAPYSDNQTSDRDIPEAGNTSISVNSRVSCPAPANY
ncbi:protein TIFY 6B-like isoform X1 [Primulina huaijiensis]|uniref:protein TIFY 6B-like isoform X1 n=2 Tax=Primulina huaijiensis TaxID=1492673 RepID=UPI003CC71801